MDEAVIKAKVDEFAKWVDLADAAKKEIEKFKAEFQKLAEDLMNNKKIKQVEFWGTKNAKVVVTTTETTKLTFISKLKEVMEKALNDCIKEEDPKYKMTDYFKHVATAIFQGTYMEQSVDEVIAQISGDEKVRKTLKKKLRGKWNKDVEHLKNIAGLDDKEAEYFAYFIQEAFNYEKIVLLLTAAGYREGSDGFEDALRVIKNAVIVEEGIKVGLEIEVA